MKQYRNKIVVAHGDGIGPEIMDATLSILSQAGASLDIKTIEIGENVYKRGIMSGIEDSSIDELNNAEAFLKAPITTPQGGGFKSLNVTIRKLFGLYANIRPCISYAPYVKTKHPSMDVVIVRENGEDLYTGIEHRQTEDVVQCLKLISKPGCEDIVRYAFEYAKLHNRKKVTCFTKDNIMKMTDGLFHSVFEEISEEYKDIESEHWIVDIGAAKLADTPENFDVIVMPNLYGDILSDVAAQIAGSVGLAGSSNIGHNFAMFEAIHGSAPRRAGLNMANPSGLLLASIMMLVHLKQIKIAETIHNAWLKTIEDGFHTYDIFDENLSTKKVGTKEFASCVVERLGSAPTKLNQVVYDSKSEISFKNKSRKSRFPKEDCCGSGCCEMELDTVDKKLVGVDIFICKSVCDPAELANSIKDLGGQYLKLSAIDNMGTLVWPNRLDSKNYTDHWRCRFISPDLKPIQHLLINNILIKLTALNLEYIKLENLYLFDGKPGYSTIQGAN